MKRRHLQATYDEHASTYDSSVGRGERLFLGDFRQRFGAELRGETLEVAVGSGLNLPYYTDAMTRAVAVDLSQGMIGIATERARTLGRQIDFAQMDAQRLAFPDNSFDTVAISLSLCTVPDPVAALQEMARVCRPEGRIVLLEHVLSPVPPVAWLERLLSPLQERYIGCHLNRRTIETARSMGFHVESERRRVAGVFRLVVARPPLAVR
ncbi:MAG: class I SAM-dependent methyltransferase [Thermomicrobiales bacterium]